jgi:kynurenine 3-monooxygenase
VGSLAAIYLAKRGYHVKVYERRDDLRLERGAAEGNRSINLALSSRGIKALRAVGMDYEVLSTVIPMAARMIHPLDLSKGTHAQAYGDFGETINSVDRKLLNRKLLDKAESMDSVELFFGHELVAMDPDKGQLTFKERYLRLSRALIDRHPIGQPATRRRSMSTLYSAATVPTRQPGWR